MVVIGQYREGIGTYAYELPGGGIERAEDASKAAKRELQLVEETGLFARELTPLATIQSCGHLTNETAHLFFAAETVIPRRRSTSIPMRPFRCRCIPFPTRSIRSLSACGRTPFWRMRCCSHCSTAISAVPVLTEGLAV